MTAALGSPSRPPETSHELRPRLRDRRTDRQQAEVDRSVASRTQADTEFLARELAAVRLALADMVTMDELRDHLEKLVDSVGELTERVAPQVAPQPE